MKNSNKNIYIYDLNNSWINTNNTSKSSLLETSNLIENNNNEFIDDKHIIAIDTYINLEKTYDYYKNKFNRNSIDNKGMNVEGFIHFGENMCVLIGLKILVPYSLGVMKYIVLICQSL